MISNVELRFLVKLFEQEVPELAQGIVEVKAIIREPGSRAKIAVHSNDDHIDPVGSLVGQRGVRVSTVMSELGGEKIDIIEWSEDPKKFIEEALSPAKVINIEVNEDDKTAQVEVSSDQQSLAIGRGGQNVRLAAKLTGWKIDIQSMDGEELDEDDNPTDEEQAPEEEPVEQADTETPTEETPEEGAKEESGEEVVEEPEAEEEGSNESEEEVKDK